MDLKNFEMKISSRVWSLNFHILIVLDELLKFEKRKKIEICELNRNNLAEMIQFNGC
jgi:hypothetical protein